ncbi:Sulfur carrier protein ThiS adenylyltransferase [Buchnera aphidicola (Neophyllaphis podocarpi)]|uniref:HesA/MoeB/ThiF family protein n=1 Tax=Buchnera aphidicola TaxID=9 RepID=UPI0034647E2C
MLNNEDFLRYSRNLLLKNFNENKQLKLKNSTILIVGIGGLGAPVALYLAAAGVGKMYIADHDNLDISNLQRQIVYFTKDIGKKKVFLSKEYLLKVNPNCIVKPIPYFIDKKIISTIIDKVDLVIDCSDNFKTRSLINNVCVMNNKPLIIGSAIGLLGQIIIIMPPWDCGCYNCIWKVNNNLSNNCDNFGVLGPIVGIIGSFQALECLKLLTNECSSLKNKIYLFDGNKLNHSILNLQRSSNCNVCGVLYD